MLRRTLLLVATLALVACSKGGETPSPTTPGAPSTAPAGSGEGAAAAAPGTNPTAGAKDAPVAARELVVYCGRNEEMLRPVLDRFARESGVPVRTQFAGSAQLAATISEEGARSPADLFFSQDASTIQYMADQGLLAPLPDALLQRVPPNARHADGLWVGTSGRARVLVYNRDTVRPDQLPTQVDALTDPAWRGQVGWSPENASFQSFIGAMLVERGEPATRAWLDAMKANQPRAYPSNTPIVAAVGAGEIRVGLTNHYYLHRLRAEKGPGFPAENHYFANGAAESMINLSAVGVLKTADAPDEAHRLIAFLLSDEIQRHFAEQTHEFPLVADTAPSGALPALSALNPPVLGTEALGNLEAVQRVLRETGVLP